MLRLPLIVFSHIQQFSLGQQTIFNLFNFNPTQTVSGNLYKNYKPYTYNLLTYNIKKAQTKMDPNLESFQMQQEQTPYYEDYYQELEPPKDAPPFEIIPQSSLFKLIKELTEETKQTVALEFGWSLLILREFKWQKDSLGDYFFNMKKYKNLIGYSEKFLTTEQVKKMSHFGECGVCADSGTLIVNICQHGFCRSCWAGHIEEHLNNMNPFMKCMCCQAPLLYDTVKDILLASNNIAYQKLYNKYQKQICQFFTSTSHSYKCCTGADCTYCIKCENYSVTAVKCICGKSFCFKCQSDDHSPCTCEEKSKWTEIVLKEEANAKWIAQNTKLCPWCNKAVERSQGCNFMACLCGKSFCYMCSKPWEPDHKDHFKCHIYKKRNDDEVSREKAVLEKLNFYAEKYLNINGLVQVLKKFDTFQKRKLLYEKLSIALPESDFIDQAYKFAIDCCQSLKWIYVYTYFVQILDENRKQRFLFSQGQYQSFKQELQKKLSVDLKNFLVNLQKHLQLNHGTFQPEMKKKFTEEFWSVKTNIINYYRFTQQFKEKFVEEIQGLDSSIVNRCGQNQMQQKMELKEDKKKKK